MLKETNEKYEKQINDLKEENLENRLDLEAKIDEKSKAIQNLKNSNENTIEELKYKIEELNIVIDSYKQKEKEDNNSKKKKKKNNSIDDEVVQYKLDGIISRIDNLQNVLFKTEIEKVRNQMLTEMDAKYEEVQDQFKNKLKTTKRNCENFLKRLKESKDTEIEKLKQIIKDLNDEIQDYKSQVDSQEYKISLFKEKIINYEKEKKQQTDHAELLRVLALKLNGYIEMLSKGKK
jgi:chromosome segregation ATPase